MVHSEIKAKPGQLGCNIHHGDLKEENKDKNSDHV